MSSGVKTGSDAISRILKTFISPSRYSVTFPEFNPDTSMYCKTLVLPGKETKTTEFFFDGIKYPIAREDVYKNTMEMTFYMDNTTTDVKNIRASFIKWMQADDDGVHKYNNIDIEYFSNHNSEEPAGEYKIFNAIPTEVSEISLSSDSASIPEYTVTFSYSHYDKIS